MVKKAEAGDTVELTTKKGKEKGVLLESYESGVILLKIESGYNIGFKKEDVKKIRLIEKRVEPEETEVKKGSGKPRVDIITTGGTIVSSLDLKTGGVKDLTTPGELFKYYPEIFDLADVKVEGIPPKATENMDFSDWQRIAKRVVKSLNDSNVQGVIVMAGTDFLHYLSAALSFFVRDLGKPLVITYSQRSSDRGSSDARLNLECAMKAALSDVAEVMVVGHGSSDDTYCNALLGTKCRKMHTSRRDAFKSINISPLAKISDKMEILRDVNKRSKGKCKFDGGFEERVGLIKFYPGQDPAILDWYGKKYKGLVIEASGIGGLLTEGSNSWLPSLRKLIAKGVVVCVASQTIYGRLDPMIYSPGRQLKKLGLIFLGDMLSETALVKLGWVLGHKDWNPEEKMLENISKEFNQRLGKDFI